MKPFSEREYVRIKKFSFQKMKDFLFSIYKSGFQDGVQEALSGTYDIDLDEDEMFKIICSVPGVGMAKANKIVKAIKEASEEGEEQQ